MVHVRVYRRPAIDLWLRALAVCRMHRRVRGTSSPSPRALLAPRPGSNCPLAHPQPAHQAAEHTMLHAQDSSATYNRHTLHLATSLHPCDGASRRALQSNCGIQTRSAAPADPHQPQCRAACTPEAIFDSIRSRLRGACGRPPRVYPSPRVFGPFRRKNGRRQ
jgi:hypothetical protein